MERSSRYLPILSGVLIAAAAFALLFTFIAWIMPAFLRFAGSRWSGMMNAGVLLFVLGSGWRLRKRRSARLKRSLS